MQYFDNFRSFNARLLHIFAATAEAAISSELNRRSRTDKTLHPMQAFWQQLGGGGCNDWG